MELVFYYINKSRTSAIEKVGFNFSANYNFKVVYRDDEYILNRNDVNHIIPPNFWDDGGCISNITAIVGENGTGKTTLLTELARQNINVKNLDNNEMYRRYYEDKYECQRGIICIRMFRAK